MKKTFILAVLLLPFFVISPLSLHAQVMVDSTGALSVGRPPMKNTYFSVGDNKYSSSTTGEAGIGVYLHGFKALQDSESSKKMYYGVYSNLTTGNAKSAIAVYGRVGNNYAGNSYGVIGCVEGSRNGIGVYGTVNGYGNLSGEPVNSRYAGYFAGPTYVRGTLTATEVITPSDITLKENIISIEDEEEAVGSTLDNVMNMNVIKYTYKPLETFCEPEEDEFDEEEIMLSASKVQVKNKALEMSRQKHYGLSAQEIREIYPDVVRESEDGILGVNYLELVPILIRSIQELKSELDQLKGKEEIAKARAATFDDEETTSVGDATTIPAMATLAQNTPNPFSERTTIRFTLPENAQNAYIYVFDMSGKMKKQIPVTPDMQSITIEGYELRAGMYIYSLVVGGQEVQTRRMILSK